MNTMADNPVIISPGEVERFCADCLKSTGAKQEHAQALAVVIVSADNRGHFSHGLNRLPKYIKDLKKGLINTKDEPKIIKETVSTASIDGCNCLGPVVGNFSMKIAIEKAKKTGIGWVVANRSNHYGIAGWYSMIAMEEGLIGMSFTNTSPLVLPTGSKQVALGTNPISVAAPGKIKEDSIVIDMATSAVALGKIEMKNRSKALLPLGWAADSNGKVTDDPVKALKGGLLPLGGSEETGGYKGYSLGLMVELFCGMLSNSSFGQNVRKWDSDEAIANLGQCFVAIDPKAFVNGFTERISKLSNEMRNLPRANEKIPVLVPGDPERIHIEKCKNLKGIPYVSVLIKSMDELAEELKVKALKRN